MHVSLSSPTLNRLKVLEAVVRTGSVKDAADELSVSASAVSHQIKGLEEECGTALFRRERRRLVPLPLALATIDQIGDAFQRLADAHLMLITQRQLELVSVIGPTSFTVGWLFSRAQAFRILHPQIDLLLQPSDNPYGFRRNGAQIIIHHGLQPEESGWRHLGPDVRVVLGTKEIIAKVHDLNDPTNVPLIRPKVEIGAVDGQYTWEDWLASRHTLPRHPLAGPYASQGHLAVRMALRGEGLVLAEVGQAQEHVASGALFILPGSRVGTKSSYWCKCFGPKNRNVDLFTDWLSIEMSRQQEY